MEELKVSVLDLAVIISERLKLGISPLECLYVLDEFFQLDDEFDLWIKD